MKNLDLYNEVREVPKEAQKTIRGGRLKGMTDINPMWRIKTLTENFGMCGVGWFYSVLETKTIPAGEEIIAVVDIHLYVKTNEKWSEPIFGTGGSKLLSQESGGMYVNDEAFKMALTDAISVACKSLGMGADIYWQSDNTKYNDSKKDTAGTKKITELEVKNIKKMAENYGKNVSDICRAYKLKSIEDMSADQYANCLLQFKKVAEKDG